MTAKTTVTLFELSLSTMPARKRNQQHIYRYAEQIIAAAGILDEETSQLLYDSLLKVPREQFVPSKFQSRIFDDIVLPIAAGHSMAKPSHQLRMLGLLGIRAGMKVLEINCGSGYTSALMSAAGVKVFALERSRLLAQQTRKKLDSIGYQNVWVKGSDPDKGWNEHGPYDAILVHGLAKEVPMTLFDQLAETDSLLVVVLQRAKDQALCLYEKNNGAMDSYMIETGRFY